jgi:hypothetical protein
MEIAIEMGMNTPDPEVQARWAEIAVDGKKPTPDMVIAAFVKKMGKANNG